MSWFGDQMVSLPLGGAFHARRLTDRLLPGRSQWPRRSARDGMRGVECSLPSRCCPIHALDVLITGESTFDNLPQVMATLASYTWRRPVSSNYLSMTTIASGPTPMARPFRAGRRL